MVRQMWIIECQKMLKISENSINFIMRKLERRTINRRTNYKRSKNPKNHLPKSFTLTTTICYRNDATQLRRLQMTKLQEKINHHMYMDDIKISTKKVKEFESLIETIRIFTQDIRMEFGI